MTLLDKYLIQRITTNFLKTLLSLITLFIIIDLMTHRRGTIMEHDVPTPIVIQYYLALIPKMLNNYQLAPLSLLIAGLLVFGTFVQRSEYTATLAGGIGLKRILLPPAAIAILTTLIMFFINDTISPKTTAHATHIEKHYFGDNPTNTKHTQPGTFWPQLQDGWKCDIQTFNRETLTGENIFLYTIGHQHHEQIQAQKIYWDENENTWMLQEGTHSIYRVDKKNTPRQDTHFQLQKAPFTQTPQYLLTSEIDTQTQSISQLATLMKKHQSQTTTHRRMKIDLNKKIIDPLLCLLFTLLALPFSIRLGRGGISIGLSIAIFTGLSYLILASITQTIGYTGQIPPIIASWFPFTAYFFITTALILRTPT